MKVYFALGHVYLLKFFLSFPQASFTIWYILSDERVVIKIGDEPCLLYTSDAADE